MDASSDTHGEEVNAARVQAMPKKMHQRRCRSGLFQARGGDMTYMSRMFRCIVEPDNNDTLGLSYYSTDPSTLLAPLVESCMVWETLMPTKTDLTIDLFRLKLLK